MNKYILPILLGAGAIFYFSTKNKQDNAPDRTSKSDEVTEPRQNTPIQSIPRKRKLASKLKDFDINKAINNVSKLKNSKVFSIVKKAVANKRKKNIS